MRTFDSWWWYGPAMNMLSGYTQTIDEATEIEYVVKENHSGVITSEMDRLLSVLLRPVWIGGEPVNGYPTWRYELNVDGDHWLSVQFDSEDGRRLRRFNAKILKYDVQ